VSLQQRRGDAVSHAAAAAEGAVANEAAAAGGAAPLKDGPRSAEKPRQLERGGGAAQKLLRYVAPGGVFHRRFSPQHGMAVAATDLGRPPRRGQPAQLLGADRDKAASPAQPEQGGAAVVAAVIAGGQTQEAGADKVDLSGQFSLSLGHNIGAILEVFPS